MTSVALYVAKNRLSELIDQLAPGTEIEITRRGRPVARILPPLPGDKATQSEGVEQALAVLASIRSKTDLTGDIKAIAREGLIA